MEAEPAAPLDLVGLGLILALCALGLYRGLWWQAIRLAGVALSVLAARWVGPLVARALVDTWPELHPRAAHGIGWGATFLLSLFSCSMLGLLGQRLLEAMQLGMANRLAGGMAGAITGLCAHVAVVVVVCQLASPTFLGRHVVGTYSERLYAALGVRWPVVLAAEAADEVDRALDEAPAPEGRPRRPHPERAPRSPEPAPPEGRPEGLPGPERGVVR